MKLSLKALALSFAPLLLTPLAHAQNVGTLTCQAANGSSISSTAFAFDIEAYGIFDAPGTYIGIASIYVDPATFAPLLAASAAQTVYNNCSLVNGAASASFTKATLDGVYLEAVGAGLEGSAAVLYTGVTLTFDSLTVGGTTVSTSKGTAASRAQAISASRAQALANLKAAR